MNNIGLITKSQKELYYVNVDGIEYKSKARGAFREKKLKPIVGDKVKIQILDDYSAYIEEILPRKNSLIRPAISNIDQIVFVQSLKDPKINYLLFDKYLTMLEHFNIPVKIIINKIDLLSAGEKLEFETIYSKTKYDYIFISVENNINIDKVYELLENKVSSLAGPSGVGKSSLINILHKNINVETGDISNKTSRGKHTTRHTELFEIKQNSYIFDTPGFSALDLSFIETEKDVKKFFMEFEDFSKQCKFNDCDHINEPKCKVKEALENGYINISRYENYKLIYEEIKNIRRYK